MGNPDYWASMIAGDYHNGALSVIVPFGIWGMIAFVWFLWGGGRLLYFNYKYGDPALQSINRFLLASFIVQAFMFFAVFGALSSDLFKFTGWLGLSVALNGGMARPVRAVVETRPIPIRIRPLPQQPQPVGAPQPG